MSLMAEVVAHRSDVREGSRRFNAGLKMYTDSIFVGPIDKSRQEISAICFAYHYSLTNGSHQRIFI
ncbi:hypothetical protein CS369_15570 [Candidatus Symbiopectobacterium sp. 'North America']|nr:hypothetical protein [Candidatus Symbiopectobacterium sp. 'North America']